MDEMKSSGTSFSPFSPAKWSNVEFGEASSLEEYAFLYGFAALLRPKTMLEIGTSTGLGTTALLAGASICGEKPQLTTIDIQSYPFKDNMAKILDIDYQIDAIIGKSEDILKELVDKESFFNLCLIDGGHDYQTVSKDWYYARHLSEIFLFHDSDSEEGVSQLIDEIKKDPGFSVISFDYKPGHKLDEQTGEWYKVLVSPGFSIVKKR